MKPLAERMRPTSLETYVGQQHLVGQGGVLRRVIETGVLPSFILWGAPGIGKTTLANIIATQLNRPFYALSAINSGVAAVREMIEKAKNDRFFSAARPVLFIDEIHRFSKSQQDSLLGAVEQGIITLIGATTENPSFEVIPALLSRCQIYTLKPLEPNDLLFLVEYALKNDEYLKKIPVELTESDALLRYSGGDARRLLNVLELVVSTKNNSENNDITENEPHRITNELVLQTIQQNISLYDKSGEMHYDIISAFIKSMRGSDPNAAVYYLARMVEGGEDVAFIARRMLIFAAEDIGLANPNALLLANACYQSVTVVGFPESRIILSDVALYLATSPKSNAAYLAIDAAQALVRATGDLPVPLNLRNAPTKLMKQLGYGAEYDYAHNHVGNFVQHDFLPEAIKSRILYTPQNNAAEQTILDRLRKWWSGWYAY
jgi:putative ATPase